MAETEQAPKDMIGFFDFYLVKKAPFQIPEGGREAIVKYGPWIAVVLLVISLPILLVALGFTAVFLPFAGAYAPGWGLSTITMLIGLGLEVAALPGLFARKMSGWRLMFYSILVQTVGSLLVGNIVGAILGALIGLYVLFQVRTKYS
jgi:hypothetical protein